jgi:hypothetical protein
MKPKRQLLVGLMAAVALAGCAVFEQTPADVQQKFSEPTKGHLYERDPLEQY